MEATCPQGGKLVMSEPFLQILSQEKKTLGRCLLLSGILERHQGAELTKLDSPRPKGRPICTVPSTPITSPTLPLNGSRPLDPSF